MPRELRDDGRTYHDVTHALAVQDARAAVVAESERMYALIPMKSRDEQSAHERAVRRLWAVMDVAEGGRG